MVNTIYPIRLLLLVCPEGWDAVSEYYQLYNYTTKFWKFKEIRYYKVCFSYFLNKQDLKYKFIVYKFERDFVDLL